MIAVLYEHPEWFKPLFAEMDRRGLAWEPLLAYQQRFDPATVRVPFSLLFNRVSPSSYLRGHSSAIFYAREYLARLDAVGIPVINGHAAYQVEVSKARQIALLARLGLPHPRSAVVNAPEEVEAAAAQLNYPIMVKPNIGGSGALMRRFASAGEVREALREGQLNLGLDHIGIVQEYHPPADHSIVRVESLDREYLYAIRIQTDPDQGFNLCPADICQVDGAASPAPAGNEFDLCAVDAGSKRALRIEAYSPAPQIVEDVLRINAAAHLDLGGVEYLRSARDGRIYYYDINALSNFVTDAPRLLGFDPFVKLVDYVERRLEASRASAA
jgi:hypothetical protein